MNTMTAYKGSITPLARLENLSLSFVCYAFVRVCLYVPCGHLLGKG